ncbi:MAG: outer membrane beta-barrel protein [Owenweeksia sp.]|nr:outer membrane beta-barrel protein [Owenweeksia sp.]
MMKKLTLALVFIFGCQALSAQREYIPTEEDWFMLDVTHLRLLEGPDGFESGTWSNGWSLNFMRDILLGKSNFSIGLGVAYTSNNFYQNMRIKVDEQTGEAQFGIIADSIDARNKVNAKYIEVPVELRFRTKPNKNGNFFRWYGGVRVGVRFSAYSLYERDDFQERYYHPDEINRWRAGAYTRIGYGTISLYGYYGFLNLFEYNTADPLPTAEVNANGMRPIAVGVSVGF